MPPRLGSVDPLRFPREIFDLYSIPAHDLGVPETLSGNEIGSSKQVVQRGDVLFSRIVPHIRRAWIVGETNGHRTIGSGEWIVLRSPDLLPDYLRHFLLTDDCNRQVMRTLAGVGGSLMRARPAGVAKILIPVPPLEEQKRIAAILDKADAIRRKREHAIQLADEFLRSLFLDMFGDPVRNPKGWPRSTFGEQLTMLQYGPRFYNIPYSANGIRTVRITDLDSSGQLAFDQMPRINADLKAIHQFRLEAGDLVFARTGATVGKTALIEEGDPDCLAGAYFIRMRFSPVVLPQYARMVLISESIQNQITEQSRQSAQQNFSGPAIRRLPLPLPPKNLQAEYLKIARSMHRKRLRLVRHSEEVDNLRSTLTFSAFRAQL